MLYKEKSFLVEDANEVDKIIWLLGQKALEKFKGKANEKAGEVANFYLLYLFGLRVCEITKYPFSLYTNLSKIKVGDKYLYKLKCFNAKARNIANKTKVVFLYPTNIYEQKMVEFIEKNWYRVGYNALINFCQRYIIAEFWAYDKNGNEVKVVSHLNAHALRHIRAWVWTKKFGEKLTQKNIGWKSSQMLMYYTRIAKVLQERELENEFINLIKQKEMH